MEIMLDLETLGTAPGSVILSIGAAAFDIHKGYQGRNFHTHLNVQVQLNLGMTVSGSTIAWWLQQSDEARFALEKAKKAHPPEALATFDTWMSACYSKGEGVWANGAAFDPVLLECLYAKCGRVVLPWHFRDVRDTRTLFALAGRKMGDFGTHNPLAHSALHDAIYQAEETAKCVNHLRGARIDAGRATVPVASTAGDI